MIGTDAMHASAPDLQRCADCKIDGEACPRCYTVWWRRKHPNVMQVGNAPELQDLTALHAALREAQQENAILKLSVPLEEELSTRIDEMCKYLAMEDGYTLAGIARLLHECQRRMAADWSDVGRERMRSKAAEQQLETLRGAVQQIVEMACRFNCDAESACECPAHKAYRKAVKP